MAGPQRGINGPQRVSPIGAALGSPDPTSDPLVGSAVPTVIPIGGTAGPRLGAADPTVIPIGRTTGPGMGPADPTVIPIGARSGHDRAPL